MDGLLDRPHRQDAVARLTPLFWVHVALIVAFVQAPYYELTERMPFILVFAALLYRDIALQSDLRYADRTRERVRSWRFRRPPAPGLALDGD